MFAIRLTKKMRHCLEGPPGKRLPVGESPPHLGAQKFDLTIHNAIQLESLQARTCNQRPELS